MSRFFAFFPGSGTHPRDVVDIDTVVQSGTAAACLATGQAGTRATVPGMIAVSYAAVDKYLGNTVVVIVPSVVAPVPAQGRRPSAAASILNADTTP